jgi:hypothetical protein
MKNIHIIFGAVIASFFTVGYSFAQDLEPRSYINLPIDQNFLAVSYVYAEGDVNVARSVPLKDGYVRIDGTVLGYARTFALNDSAAKFDIVTPYLCASGSARRANGIRGSREVCGIGDTRVRVTYNFYGAPAYDIKEFRQHAKELVVGASFQVSAPTGIYNENKILNIGANRWFFRSEVGMTFPWRNWGAEISLGAKIFGDNKDLIGDKTLSQDPLYNAQLHLVYDFNPRQWLAFDMNYFWAGKTQKDGRQTGDYQRNSMVGVTFSQVLSRQILAKLFYNRGLTTRIGNDSETVGLALLYRY